MPGDIDGLALAREVAMRWPETNIVAVSAAVRPEHGALPAKPSFLAKPFSPALLDQAVSRWERERSDGA